MIPIADKPGRGMSRASTQWRGYVAACARAREKEWQVKKAAERPAAFCFSEARRSVRDFFLQDLDQLADAAAVVVDDGGELLAMGIGEAQALDLDVRDLVAVAHLLDGPVDPGWIAARQLDGREHD